MFSLFLSNSTFSPRDNRHMFISVYYIRNYNLNFVNIDICRKITFTGNLSDILECAEFPCDPNANCEEIPGSFVCTCMEGFTGDGLFCEGN